MSNITRRQLGLTAAGLALAGRAGAQPVPSVTRNLPRTYAGTTLNIVWGPGPVNAATAAFTKELQDATAINIQWTTVAPSERSQKTILDLTSNTNSFHVYLNAYQWKQHLAPIMTD